MTRLFRDGRTETIRSLSSASVAFVKAMLAPKESNENRIALLKKAADQHQVLVEPRPVWGWGGGETWLQFND